MTNYPDLIRTETASEATHGIVAGATRADHRPLTQTTPPPSPAAPSPDRQSPIMYRHWMANESGHLRYPALLSRPRRPHVPRLRAPHRGRRHLGRLVRPLRSMALAWPRRRASAGSLHESGNALPARVQFGVCGGMGVSAARLRWGICNKSSQRDMTSQSGGHITIPVEFSGVVGRRPDGKCRFTERTSDGEARCRVSGFRSQDSALVIGNSSLRPSRDWSVT